MESFTFYRHGSEMSKGQDALDDRIVNHGAYVPSITLKKTAIQNNLENSYSKDQINIENQSLSQISTLNRPRTFLDLNSQTSTTMVGSSSSFKTSNIIDGHEAEADCTTNVSILPDGVDDIDAKDSSLPNHLPAYVMDIYRYSKWKELQSDCRLHENFLSQSKVTQGNRCKLLDWMINVHRSFKLLPETLHLSCRLLDLVLCHGAVSNRQLQLYGIACMWIACKMEEIYPPPMSDFLIVTDNAFDEHEMCECEKSILMTLNFDINPPTSLHFLKRAAKVTRSDVITYVMAKYLLELVILEYSLAHFLPSHVAAAALLTSHILLNYKKTSAGKTTKCNIWDNNAVYYTAYQEGDLIKLGFQLAKCVERVTHSRDKNQVFIKYKSETFQSVSLAAECKFASMIFGDYMQNKYQSRFLEKFNQMKINHM